MRFGFVPAVCLASLLTVLLPAPAHAQAPLQRNTWLLTGLAGLALDSDANASLTIAGAAAYPLSSQFAIEGELAHVLDLSPGDASVDSSMTTVHGTALYFFDTPYVLTPYVAAGFGVGKYSVDVKEPKDNFSTTEAGFNLGAGVLYPLGGAASVRGDFRYFNHADNTPSVWRFAAGVAVRVGS